MGWSIGSDGDRDIGYGVPAECDYPKCKAEINRGLSYVCGGQPHGGEKGCGLFFCKKHLDYKESNDSDSLIQLCKRCFGYPEHYDFVTPFEPKPDIAEWINHKLTDESWQEWRDENPEEVERMKKEINK